MSKWSLGDTILVRIETKSSQNGSPTITHLYLALSAEEASSTTQPLATGTYSSEFPARAFQTS